MNVRPLFLTLLSLIVSTGLPQPAFAADASAAPAHQKLILQVSDGNAGTWNQSLNVARNVQQEFGAKNVEIELVVYGLGIGMLKMDSPLGTRVAEAMAAGVKVVACTNTMTGQKLTQQDMLPDIGYVKSGVAELMRRQQQGWVYIRP
jgi:uncharacterized protein